MNTTRDLAAAHPEWRVVAATGHRPKDLTPREQAWVKTTLWPVVNRLRDRYGMTLGLSGMAPGTDTWWAQHLVKAGVPFSAHIPFPQQPDRWPPKARAEWERLRGLADSEQVYGDIDGLSGGVRDRRVVQLLHERNDGMLRAADAVVAVWIPSKHQGGTYSVLRKARQLGLPIVHLNPRDRTIHRVGGVQ